MERCISAFSGRSTERVQTLSFDDVSSRISENGGRPILIVFSSDFDNFTLYSDLFKKEYPDSHIIGTTSFYNCAGGEGSEHGLSALAVYDGIECCGGVLTEAERCPILHVKEAENAIASLNIGAADTGRVCCLEFTTAFGRCEELVLDTLRKAAGSLDIPVMGSTAGVRRGTGRSYVSLDGKVYENACVFMYIRNLHGRIAFIRENAYRHTEHFFQLTSVDCDKRIAYEFNGRPAAVYLASLLGVDIPVLARDIALHPIGRIYGDRIYTADGERVEKNGAITFYAHVYNYSRAVLLEPDDFKTVSDRFFGKLSEIGFAPSFSLAVNCVFDYDIYSGKGFTQDMVKRLGERLRCFVGVSGCGEQTEYMHLNKTLLLAAFE